MSTDGQRPQVIHLHLGRQRSCATGSCRGTSLSRADGRPASPSSRNDAAKNKQNARLVCNMIKKTFRLEATRNIAAGGEIFAAYITQRCGQGVVRSGAWCKRTRISGCPHMSHRPGNVFTQYRPESTGNGPAELDPRDVA
jgi:hypothetical protein